MAEPDSVLIQRAQGGDRSAMAELVMSQQRYVYSVAMTLMRNPADAADLTQDAFVRLIRALPTYRAETRFTTWLYRLVVNLGLDEMRRRSRRIDPMTLDDDAAPDPPDLSSWSDPVTRAIGVEDAERVRLAVQTLPVPQRLALTFYYFEEMTYEEIATVMDVPLNTVKSYIHRAKAKLAITLAERPPATLLPNEAPRALVDDSPPGAAGLRLSLVGMGNI